MSAPQGGSQPDLYAILGINQDAAREQVVQAWRRRARAEHPDSRPYDADAPARFRALAEAYRVLADPGRRAAYDRVSGHQPSPRPVDPQQTPGRTPAGGRPGTAGQGPVNPIAKVPDPPLRAGPVWVQPLPHAQQGDALTDEENSLAELMLRHLAEWERRW